MAQLIMKVSSLTGLLLAGLLLLQPVSLIAEPGQPLQSSSKPKAIIAIIIDDIGNNFARGKQAVNLPGAVTLSILPHTPDAVVLANLAHANGKEVMLHAPMSNIQHMALGKGALTVDMNQGNFARTLVLDLQSVPHVQGINNHMGSLLTQREEPMRWLMQVIRQKDLYFVDSRTSADSRAQQIAAEEGIPNLKRDFFLDNDQNVLSIAAQFRKFISHAKKTGYGVAIGHPYPETLLFLEEVLPTLSDQQVKLVRVSELLVTTGSAPNIDLPAPRRSSQNLDGRSHYIDRLHPLITE